MFPMVAAMLVISAAIVVAQPSSDCATKLTPCSQFLSSINPPKECCDSLGDAITNDLTCLCNLYTSGVLKSMGLNVSEVLLLPKKCGLNGDLNGAAPPTTILSFVPPAPYLGGNGAGRESWRGILSVLLLIFASVMAF